MIEYVNIDEIVPAEYNPRIINDKEFELLKNSIKDLGIIVPIIINETNNIIIAGHQRARTLKALNFKEVPIIKVKDISLGDEMKLNQLHNGIDKEPSKRPIVERIEDSGFIIVKHNDFTVFDSVPVYVREICNLIIKYGNILSCVICNGEVIMGGNYVKACKLLGYNVNAYILNAELKEKALKYLYSSYGKYNYHKIEKNTYIQGLAQLHRNPTRNDGKKAFKSQLYENYVIPYLKQNESHSVLDFGSGKGAYVNLLSNEFDIMGLEFFNNNGFSIDVEKGNKMIDELLNKLTVINGYDTIVCDSVLNSVDSHEAEEHILSCLNLFLKMNGKLFISGRSLDSMNKDTLRKRDTTTTKRFIEFTDDRGLTSNYRKGQWYFQKFHSKDEIRNNLSKAGFEIESEKWANRGFYIVAKKSESLTKEKYINAINFEFNLPLPNGEKYGRNVDVLNVLSFK